MDQALTIGVWVALAAFSAAVLCRARFWAQGREAPFSLRALLTVPKRYFVDLHGVVARDPYMARTHVAVAGGGVALLGGIVCNYGLALYLPALDVLIAAAAIVMAAGAVSAALRRLRPPSRLSRGAWMRLPYTLLAFAFGCLLIVVLPLNSLAAPVSALVLLLILAGAVELVLGVGLGAPMKHAVAGLLHLACHPRPERFGAGGATALRKLDLNDEVLGVARAADFAWNRLLSFDACVQCGKCEAACPAFAAGQPLNPKKLIQDLVTGMVGSGTGQLMPGVVASDTLWSCTTCRACVQECPMLIEHVDAIVDLRRHQTLQHGELPLQSALALDRLRETETLGGHARAARYDWAVDLEVDAARPGVAVDYLLIAGEGAFEPRYQRTLRALVRALKSAGVDFAVFGEQERDCGDVARRLGDEDTFTRLARRNIETLGRLAFRRIVTPDPHVLHSLRNEYPALGGHYEVVHHATLLEELVRDGRLPLKRPATPRRVTYHDPCYLARYNGETQAPRALLRGIGIRVEEMGRSGLRARCCGGGGGAALADIPGKRRIPDLRMEDAQAVGAEVVAVACPNCTAMLEGVAGPRPEVKDLAELVEEALAS